jgi:hypothetical protein
VSDVTGAARLPFKDREERVSDLDRLRRYALGLVPEEGAEDLEQRLLVDEDLHQQLELIEDALVEDYVAGAMAGTDRATFETRLARDPRLAEHARHAALLRERLATRSPRPAWARYWLAAVLVLAVSALLWRLATIAPAPRRDAHAPPPPSATPTPADPRASERPATAVVSLTLSPGQTMSDDADSVLTLPSAAATLRLELMIEGIPVPAYTAELLREDGGRAWRQEDVRADAAQRVATVELPAAGLAAGRYRLELSPRGGRPASPLPYYFEVRR